jgi:hypothetical protein
VTIHPFEALVKAIDTRASVLSTWMTFSAVASRIHWPLSYFRTTEAVELLAASAPTAIAAKSFAASG